MGNHFLDFSIRVRARASGSSGKLSVTSFLSEFAAGLESQ